MASSHTYRDDENASEQSYGRLKVVAMCSCLKQRKNIRAKGMKSRVHTLSWHVVATSIRVYFNMEGKLYFLGACRFVKMGRQNKCELIV